MKFNGKQFVSEFLASFILALMGLGMVFPLATGNMDLYQFSVLFGLLVAFVIILFNTSSGAEFNPGVTLSMVVTKRQPAGTVVVTFLLAQFLGWFAGAACIYGMFWEQLKEFNASGMGNSVNLFFCHMDNIWTGIWIEFIWTAFLLMLVLACIDDRIVNKPGNKLFPLTIGAYIILAVAFGANYTGMALNAARDFGPRVAGLIFGLINGYDVSACFSDGQFVIYLLAPTAGAIAGTLFYDHVIAKLLPKKEG